MYHIGYKIYNENKERHVQYNFMSKNSVQICDLLVNIYTILIYAEQIISV